MSANSVCYEVFFFFFLFLFLGSILKYPENCRWRHIFGSFTRNLSGYIERSNRNQKVQEHFTKCG